MNKDLIFTINSFCFECFSHNEPRLLDSCLIYDYKKKRHFYLRFQNYIEIFGPVVSGFTPHIIKMLEQKLNCVEYEMSCGVCGYSITKNTGDKVIFNDLSKAYFSVDYKLWRGIYSRKLSIV